MPLSSGRPFLLWLAACAVGGAIAALDPTIALLGIPVLFGALLGGTQALFLRDLLPGAGPWVAASFIGWFAGSVVQAFWYEVLPGADGPGFGLLVESLPWGALGAGQAIMLFASGRTRPMLLAVLWTLASILGGTLTEAAVAASTSLFYAAVGGVLGEFVTGAVQLGLLAAVFYSVPTGSVLALMLRRATPH